MPRQRPRWWQRLLQRVAATRTGARLCARVAHRLDLLLLWLSRGRVSTAGLFAGLPTIRLTTVGAKTGKERTVPVMGMRDGSRWIVVASNWGGEAHPAWYHNLQATPEVEVTYRGETDRYVAREATEEERAAYWERATELYVGFEPYDRRSGEREIPVVVLEPEGE